MKKSLNYTIILLLSFIVFSCGSPSDCECEQLYMDAAYVQVTGDFDYNDFDMDDYEDCVEKYIGVKDKSKRGLTRDIWATPIGWFGYLCEND